jgi:hypothetical protein
MIILVIRELVFLIFYFKYFLYFYIILFIIFIFLSQITLLIGLVAKLNLFLAMHSKFSQSYLYFGNLN